MFVVYFFRKKLKFSLCLWCVFLENKKIIFFICAYLLCLVLLFIFFLKGLEKFGHLQVVSSRSDTKGTPIADVNPTDNDSVCYKRINQPKIPKL